VDVYLQLPSHFSGEVIRYDKNIIYFIYSLIYTFIIYLVISSYLKRW